MRSAWRSTHGLPMKARMAIAAQAAPASISTSRRPSESGENVTAEPANIATSAGARNGVTAMQTSSRASVMAALSPIRAASAGEAKIGGATMLSTSASSSAGDWPRRSMALNASAASTGATSMIQAAAAIRSCGLASCARKAPGSTRRNARHSSMNTVSGKNGRTSAPSGGRKMPSRIEMATAVVPWRPSQASAAAMRSSSPIVAA